MKLQSLMEKTDVKCPECGAVGCDIQKKGLRKSKRQKLQKYYCKKCGRYFVMKKMLHKSYPTNVILNAISFYNKGMSLADASKEVNRKFKVKTSPRLISSWMKEFSDICTFRRFRKKIREERSGKKSGFSNPIFSHLMEHKQPYLYEYHKLKMNLFLTDYYTGLRNYLMNVLKICPHELFLKDNVRGSQIKLNYKSKEKVQIEKKNSYACKLAEIALKVARTNKERHTLVQDFMLVNDTSTLAVEVPIWLTKEEVGKINSEFNVFPELSKNVKSKDISEYDKSEIEGGKTGGEIEGEITGHIDIVQARYGLIYVLDYKPLAERVDAVEQLFTYALALSVRTDVWLRNFRCAWFDEKGYYEFNPNDIILACALAGGKAELSESQIKKYVLNEKARNYFTSLKFHERYAKNVKDVESVKQATKEEVKKKQREKEKLEREWKNKLLGTEKEKEEEKEKEPERTKGILIQKDEKGRIVGKNE